MTAEERLTLTQYANKIRRSEEELKEVQERINYRYAKKKPELITKEKLLVNKILRLKELFWAGA